MPAGERGTSRCSNATPRNGSGKHSRIRGWFLSPARQSGKTTLAKEIAAKGMQFVTLDDPTTLDAARTDPVGFLRGIDRAVIDEVQRAPELLLPIKVEVDRDRRPGRFLLTGSANLMTMPKVADSLAGRMETVSLLPLAQSEILGQRSTFVDNLLSGHKPTVDRCLLGEDLVEAVLCGGYPEALSRSRWSRRHAWYTNYVNAIVQRDIKDVAQVEQLAVMPRLLRVIAEHSGQLVNYSSIGSAVGLNHVTTQKYLRIFESLFIVETVSPWFTASSTTDGRALPGLGLRPMRESPRQVRRAAPPRPVLEPFVYSEVRKIAAWSDRQPSVFHFRDREGVEVDIVLETSEGYISGIEIKAAASVTSQDFKGLRKLEETLRDRFTQGVVLYDGDQVVSFGNNLFAAPISSLWSAT